MQWIWWKCFWCLPSKNFKNTPISSTPSVCMKQRKNFIKFDIGISSKLREITQFDFKSGKIGWLNWFPHVTLCVCVCVCVCVWIVFTWIVSNFRKGKTRTRNWPRNTKKNRLQKGYLSFKSLLVTWCTNSLTFNNSTLCPHCIYVFCIYLRTNSDLCHLHHKLIGFYNRDEKCLLRGTNWIFK